MKWEQEDPNVKIYFRPKTNDSLPKDFFSTLHNDENSDDKDNEDEEIKLVQGDSVHSLLFVYQAKWQRELLRRYGNEIIC